MTDREDRSDRLRKRFEDEQDAGSDSGTDAGSASGRETDSTADDRTATGKATGSGDADDSPSVKDRPSVLMYLPEDTRRELDIRFDELNARYKREHGEPLEKNRDYYPAVIRAGLEGESIEEILDL